MSKTLSKKTNIKLPKPNNAELNTFFSSELIYYDDIKKGLLNLVKRIDIKMPSNKIYKLYAKEFFNNSVQTTSIKPTKKTTSIKPTKKTTSIKPAKSAKKTTSKNTSQYTISKYNPLLNTKSYSNY